MKSCGSSINADFCLRKPDLAQHFILYGDVAVQEEEEDESFAADDERAPLLQ
jgi:hypothetical protein